MRLLRDKERCTDCGLCTQACPNGVVIPRENSPAKCDFCLGNPRCVEACPYGCLKLGMDEDEEDAVRRLVGWEKIDCGRPERVLEVGRNYEVAEIGGRAFFLTRAPGVGPEEACLLGAVIAAFRESCENWDSAIVGELVEEYCETSGLSASSAQQGFLVSRIEREVRGLSVLDEFVRNSCLEEIAVIGPGQPLHVYHRSFGWLQTDVRITDAAKILKLINRIGRQMGRRATMREPRLNAPIEGGRMHAAVAPVAASGNCMTLRLFGDRGLGPADLVGNSTITAEALAFLKLAVLSDANILVCGNTGSGKTTLLNVLAGFFPERERIIVVEETPEMRINHDHCVRLCVHDGLDIGMHELVTDTLRMRPDRVIVGEVRTAEEARALMDTMLAGQGKSSLATFHSQNSDEALVRLRQLGLGAADLCSLDLVVVQRRWTLNSEMPRDVRRVTEISSVKKDYAAGAGVEQVYAYEPARDALVRKGGGPDIRGKIRASFGLDEKGLERLLAGTAKGLAADA